MGAINDDQAFRLAMVLGGVTNVGADVHLWAIEALPIGITGGVEYKVLPFLCARALIEPTLLIPIGSHSLSAAQLVSIQGTGTTEFLSLQRLEAEARHESGLGGGLAWSFLALWTSGSDLMQMSMEPFVGYRHDGFFTRLGLLMPLDTPLGFTFDQDKVLTLRTAVGGTF